MSSPASTRRVAVTMWEYSWLVRRTGAEAEYTDRAKVLDELAEREYTCVRIDAFPQLVAADRDGGRREDFTILAQPPVSQWGNHEQVDVREPGAELIDFVRGCAERGITVALSSWFLDDSGHRRDEIAEPADLVRVWVETLEVLAAADLLGSIEWVDLCNELPMHAWLPTAADRIFDGGDPIAGPEEWKPAWTADTVRRMNAFLAAAADLRDRWPGLRYTYSFAPVTESLFDLDASAFDLVETHVWLQSNVEDYERRSRGGPPHDKVTEFFQYRANLLEEAYWPHRDRLLTDLRTQMARWADWSRERNLPLYTTEGWSHVSIEGRADSGRSAWDYVRDVGEYAVTAAVELGWEGICTSNFSQPHFPELWTDLAWHQRLNRVITA